MAKMLRNLTRARKNIERISFPRNELRSILGLDKTAIYCARGGCDGVRAEEAVACSVSATRAGKLGENVALPGDAVGGIRCM